jgi:hypothetical protein
MELMSREEKLLSRTFSKRIAEVTGFITANKSEELQEKYRAIQASNRQTTLKGILKMNVKKINDKLFEATIVIDNIRHSCLGATAQEAVDSLKEAIYK